MALHTGRLTMSTSPHSRNFFGTDGIRGLYGQYPLTPKDMWSLGWAVGRWILDQGEVKPFVMVGRDTRASGKAIEAALTGGLVAAGVSVVAVGCAPTPAVAFLTRAHKAAMGLMISASHNPAPYNGVKFFNAQGEKLSLAQEREISQSLIHAQDHGGSDGAPMEEPELLRDYEDFLQKNTPSLRPLRLVVDCAHGAYSALAPQILHARGAEIVHVMGASPDGNNINGACGSVYPQGLVHAVRSHGAEVGLGFDGDGDRLIIVTAEGLVQDGDQILAALAREQHTLWPLSGIPSLALDREKNPWGKAAPSPWDNPLALGSEISPHAPHGLEPRAMPLGVVGTVVSNLGLEHFLKSQHIPFVRTEVGDRWIAQGLKELGWNLGGEPCGHLVLAQALPTGDGLLAGMHVLHLMGRHGNLFPVFQSTPSITMNMTLRRGDFCKHPQFLDYQRRIQSTLHEESRVLLRASGTEPVLRILVEGPCQDYVEHLAGTIAQTLENQQNALP